MANTPAQTIRNHPASSGSLGLAAVVVAAINLLGLDLSSQQYNSVVILCGATPGVISAIPTAVAWVKQLGKDPA